MKPIAKFVIAAVELPELPRGRPIRQVALEIPRSAVLFGRHAQRDDAGFTLETGGMDQLGRRYLLSAQEVRIREA